MINLVSICKCHFEKSKKFTRKQQLKIKRPKDYKSAHSVCVFKLDNRVRMSVAVSCDVLQNYLSQLICRYCLVVKHSSAPFLPNVPSAVGEDLSEVNSIKASSLIEVLPPIFNIGQWRGDLHKNDGCSLC